MYYSSLPYFHISFFLPLSMKFLQHDSWTNSILSISCQLMGFDICEADCRIHYTNLHEIKLRDFCCKVPTWMKNKNSASKNSLSVQRWVFKDHYHLKKTLCTLKCFWTTPLHQLLIITIIKRNKDQGLGAGLAPAHLSWIALAIPKRWSKTFPKMVLKWVTIFIDW